jgi:hypothetical protein
MLQSFSNILTNVLKPRGKNLVISAVFVYVLPYQLPISYGFLEGTPEALFVGYKHYAGVMLGLW